MRGVCHILLQCTYMSQTISKECLRVTCEAIIMLIVVISNLPGTRFLQLGSPMHVWRKIYFLNVFILVSQIYKKTDFLQKVQTSSTSNHLWKIVFVIVIIPIGTYTWSHTDITLGLSNHGGVLNSFDFNMSSAI